MSDDNVRDLAIAAGLEPQWVDALGEPHMVTPETLRIVLKALGLPADSESQIAQSRAQLSATESHPWPLLTAWSGEAVALGAADAVGAGSIRIVTAQGETFDARFVKTTDGSAAIAAPHRPGYYRLLIGREERRLAVAPLRAFSIEDASPKRRLAGTAVQIYSVRGGHTKGFGDFAALGDFAERAARHGLDAIAVSPTHALFTSDPSWFSPYSPSTRLFYNPLYADTALVTGSADKDDDADGLIDWPRAGAQKLDSLKQAYALFCSSPKQQESFRAFCAEEGERLFRHAIFDVLDAKFRAERIFDWRNWPVAFRDAGSPEVAAFAHRHAEAVDYQRFLQWLSALSANEAQRRARVAGMAIGIISDLAIGMNPNGSHAWSAPTDVLLGLSVGAPPDLLGPAGQDWGLTGLLPAALKREGFSAFIATLRALMKHAGGVRIDHAMGLMRLWVIPEGASAAEGVYLRYPFQDLLRLIVLESHLNRAVVIGEDLGTVPAGFSDMLRRRGIAGMQVLWFERVDGGFTPAKAYSEGAVAMTTTHDLPTVAGWWSERDIDWQAKLKRPSRLGGEAGERLQRAKDRLALWSTLARSGCAGGSPPSRERPEAAVEAALCHIGATPSHLAIAPIEDLLALREQPNIPGTMDEHPNWRRRLPPGDAFAAAGISARVEQLVRARRRS